MGSYNKRISDQSKIKFDPINRELIDTENSEIDSRVDALDETVGDATSGLVKYVSDLATADTTINDNLSVLYKIGAKNFLPITLSGIKSTNITGTWVDNVYTLNGVTFTILTDSNDNVIGIHIEGTATGNTTFYLFKSEVQINADTYTLSVNTNMQNGNRALSLAYDTNSQKDILSSDDLTFPITSKLRECNLFVWNEASVDFTIKPMLRIADDSFSEFRPYAMTNLELTNKVADLESRVYALEHPTP